MAGEAQAAQLALAALGMGAGAKSANSTRRQQARQFEAQQAQAQIDRALQQDRLKQEDIRRFAPQTTPTSRTTFDPITGGATVTDRGSSVLERQNQIAALTDAISARKGLGEFQSTVGARQLETAKNRVQGRDDPTANELKALANLELTKGTKTQQDAENRKRSLASVRRGESTTNLDTTTPDFTAQAGQLGRQQFAENEQARRQGQQELQQALSNRFGQSAVPRISSPDTRLQQSAGINALNSQTGFSALHNLPKIPDLNITPDQSIARGLSSLGNVFAQQNQNDQVLKLINSFAPNTRQQVNTNLWV